MSNSKYYVVTIGEDSQIYTSWEDAKENGQGVPGAMIKSFQSVLEAKSYIEKLHEEQDSEFVDEKDYDDLVLEDLKQNRLVAFTDGGYSSKGEQYGFGVYILEPSSSEPVEISDVVRTDKFKKSNNIGPEVFAVINALDWALSKGYSSISIYHDYIGISKWASGEYKAKSEIAKWFTDKLNKKYNDLLDIKFIHVPGHSGVLYNEEADRLATEAMNKNTNPIFNMNESYFSCQSVGQKDFFDIVKRMKNIPGLKYEKEGDKTTAIIRYKFFYKKDTLTVNFYRSKSRTLAQGKQTNLFAIFLSYYTEKISDFELNDAYSSVYRVRIEFKTVGEYISSLNLPRDYPKDAIKFIRQSISEMIAMQKSNKEFAEDYGGYVFPAYRALEGHLKYLIEKSGNHVTKQVTDYFEKIDGHYVLKNRECYEFNNEIECAFAKYIEKRHSLAHFGELYEWDISESDTYLIEHKEVAIDMIKDILDVIRFS